MSKNTNIIKYGTKSGCKKPCPEPLEPIRPREPVEPLYRRVERCTNDKCDERICIPLDKPCKCEYNPCRCVTKPRCCDDKDVFEYVNINGEKLVRQDLTPREGYPEQQGAAFLFGKQRVEDDGFAVYFDTEIDLFSVGNGKHKGIENLVEIGNDNTITDSEEPKVIGSDNSILFSNDAEIFGDDNIIENSNNTSTVGDSNQIRNSEEVAVVGDNNQLLNKTKAFVGGFDNSLLLSPESSEEGVVVGVNNTIQELGESLLMTKYQVTGVDNSITTDSLDLLSVTGIGNSLETRTARRVVITGDLNEVKARELLDHVGLGVSNKLEGQGMLFAKTIQIGDTNSTTYDPTLLDLSSNKLGQVGSENIITANPNIPRQRQIDSLYQWGSDNIHTGGANHARQDGDLNEETLFPQYLSSVSGHGNVITTDTFSVAEYEAGATFPLSRLDKPDSSVDIAGLSNIIATSNSERRHFAMCGLENNALLGRVITGQDSLCTCFILGGANVVIADNNTSASNVVTGEHHTVFTRDAGEPIMGDLVPHVVREVDGSENVADTDRSQLYVNVSGVTNNVKLVGGDIESTRVAGVSNNINIEANEGTIQNIQINGYNNTFSSTEESAITNGRVSGSGNTISLVEDTIRNLSVGGLENEINLTTATLSADNIRLVGVGNALIFPTESESEICNLDQQGMNNSYNVQFAVDNRTGSVTQLGSGNVVSSGDTPTSLVLGVDQTGSANYITNDGYYSGFTSQSGATNYTSITGLLQNGPLYPMRKFQSGGVMDLTINDYPLQYEGLLGYGSLLTPGAKSMFAPEVTNFGVGFVNDDIIGASVTRSMVGRGLAYNAQEHNAQGTGYATMFPRSFEEEVPIGRFVTIDATGRVVIAGPEDLVIGISSVNAGFRSFEEVVYQEGYYAVEDDQSTVFDNFSNRVDYAKDILALYCCSGDYLDLLTMDALIAFAGTNCPDAVVELTAIRDGPEVIYTTSRPQVNPLFDGVFVPKSKDPDYIEVTLNGVAYVEAAPDDPPLIPGPGERVLRDANGMAVPNQAGDYIVIDEPSFGNFIPVTRISWV